MRNIAFCLLPILVAGAGCAGLGLKSADEVAPAATSIVIYSSGGSVVSGTIDPAALGAKRLRLPLTAKGINLYQDATSLKWITIQASPKSGDKDAPAADKYLLLGLPPLGAGPLKFSYALAEINWLPQLSAQILDGSKVALRLQAAIGMGANQAYEKCNVTLVLNNAVSVQSLAGHTFNLDAFDLFPLRNIMYNLDNKTADYEFVREWTTYGGGDNVYVKLRVKNPFSVNLKQTKYTVDYKQISIDYGTLETAARPGDVLSLDAGVDNTIKTFRAVKVTETPKNKELPFNHRIAYTIVNTSDEEKTLRLVSQRVTGNEHKSVYHYKTPPDATPETSLIWIIKLPPRGTHVLEYDYDADVKDVLGETGFEQGG